MSNVMKTGSAAELRDETEDFAHTGPERSPGTAE